MFGLLENRRKIPFCERNHDLSISNVFCFCSFTLFLSFSLFGCSKKKNKKKSKKLELTYLINASQVQAELEPLEKKMSQPLMNGLKLEPSSSSYTNLMSRV
jgi:hypothetical protein